MINRPNLLLADEPTGNVDDGIGIKLMRLLEELNKLGTTVVVATHSGALLERFDYPAIHLEGGRLQPQASRGGTMTGQPTQPPPSTSADRTERAPARGARGAIRRNHGGDIQAKPLAPLRRVNPC